MRASPVVVIIGFLISEGHNKGGNLRLLQRTYMKYILIALTLLFSTGCVIQHNHNHTHKHEHYHRREGKERPRLNRDSTIENNHY